MSALVVVRTDLLRMGECSADSEVDYPLSSVITAEFATTKWRGAMMGSVFAMQGIGQYVSTMKT